MAAHNELGRWGEDMAARYLQDKGYRILHRNWRSGHRDIDITAVTPDGDTLVVVEVKTRRDRRFTEPEMAVDWRKMRSLTFSTSAYVKMYAIDLDIRFDVIAIVGNGLQVMHLNHIEGAFLPPMM